MNCKFLKKKTPTYINFITNISKVRPVHEVTSIKESSVLKGHLFLIQSFKNAYELNLF